MKKILLICLISYSLLNQCVYAAEDIAVVDLQKIVDRSPQVQKLKTEHETKISELNKIILNAQKELEKETDINKMMATEEKYRLEFNQKKNKIDEEYAKKLSETENSIKKQIQTKAKEKGFDYVFAKSVLLYGGQDITDDILK
ncbi:OmpH family outer membrane protein [bacterium]|nr:OmpH family outer membrane protein [bacterium]